MSDRGVEVMGNSPRIYVQSIDPNSGLMYDFRLQHTSC
jgi:hypothetical protein